MKKKIFQLQIPEPCHEGWENMTPTEKGAFCSSCQKEVIDFSQMTPTEIANYFAHTKGKSCGRFYSKQLKEIYTYYEPQKQNNLKYAAGLALGLLVAETSIAQNDIKPKTEIRENKNNADSLESSGNLRTISGTVKDAKTGEALIGVNVSGKGTTIGTVTDIDGTYALDLPKDVTTLVFSYVGYDELEKSILSLNINANMSDSGKVLEGEIVIIRNPDPAYSYSQQQDAHWRKKRKRK